MCIVTNLQEYFVNIYMVSRFSDSGYEVVTDRLSKETLVALSNYKPVQEFIKESDYILYQRLVEILVPDVLRAVPSEYA